MQKLSMFARMLSVAAAALLLAPAAVSAAAVAAGAGAGASAAPAPLTPQQQAAHVLNRLAFGPRPGDIERVTQMGVQNYIEQQLQPASLVYPPALTARLAALSAPNRPAGELVGEFAALRKQVREDDEGARQRRRAALAAITLETAEARLARAIDSPRQLEEVMVDFWYNHFNVFAGKGIDRVLVASYERDAIRPNALGNFRTLLGATAHHPAMLYYLDNFLSSADGFSARGKVAGQKAKSTGLNENYARELMELHTLGVDGGYSQQDVTALARMLTGWTYDQRALVRRNQTFRFDAARHDDGVKHWLGRTVAPAGQAEGEMALDVLAMHPATAHHLSYELAQYFVADRPDPALVEHMAAAYLAAHGDIVPVLRVLFASEQFMAPATVGAKFKTPYQFVVSAARASAAPVNNVAPLLAALTQLGMPLYGCQTPDGYKNTEQAWLNPDALTRRIGFATALAAGRLPLAAAAPAPAQRRGAMARKGSLDPTGAMAAMASMDAMAAMTPAAAPISAAPAAAGAEPPAAPAVDALLLQATLGPAVSPRTRNAVAASAAPLRAALLLGSPDFMQR